MDVTPARRRCALAALPLMALLSSPTTLAEPYLFQPPGCEFTAEFPQAPELQSTWRGESLLNTAQVSQPGIGSMRASCMEFHVLDEQALLDGLREQLSLAARIAGVRNPRTRIRETERGTLASVWGYRGRAAHRTFYRSDTWIGARSFMEIATTTPAGAPIAD